MISAKEFFIQYEQEHASLPVIQQEMDEAWVDFMERYMKEVVEDGELGGRQG